jgi:DNA-binding transcriptional ArsR family regulator
MAQRGVRCFEPKCRETPRLTREARHDYRHSTMKTTARAARSCSPESDRPDLRPVEGTDADQELSQLAKAIGHPARIQILRILARQGGCICGDIVDELPLAQSTVSQHLAVLKEAGLVRGELSGPRVSYCLGARALRRLKALVGAL